MEKALKVKCSSPKYFSKALACLALLLAGNCARGELVQGDDPNKVYICAYAPLQGTGAQAQKAARIAAEMTSLREFIDYALRENLRLPESLGRLEEKIKQSIRTSSAKGQINGAKVIKSLIIKDGRAACFIEIPRENLNHFKGLDASQNPKAILEYLGEPKVLKLEITLELGKSADLSALDSSAPLAKVMRGEAINAASPLWLAPVTINESMMPHINDQEIMFLLDGALAIPELQDLLLAHLGKRGYSKSAKYLAGRQLPCKEVLASCTEFLATLPENCLAKEPLLKILVQHQCAIIFANQAQSNAPYEQAIQKFAGQEPKFDEIRELLLKSCLINITDQSINLLGRCYEEEGKYHEALVCYFQTYSINPENEYVGWNLANTFNKLGQKEEALYWAQSTTANPASNKWAAEMAAKLINDLTEEKRSKAEAESPKQTEPEVEVEVAPAENTKTAAPALNVP